VDQTHQNGRDDSSGVVVSGERDGMGWDGMGWGHWWGVEEYWGITGGPWSIGGRPWGGCRTAGGSSHSSRVNSAGWELELWGKPSELMFWPWLCCTTTAKGQG